MRHLLSSMPVRDYVRFRRAELVERIAAAHAAIASAEQEISELDQLASGVAEEQAAYPHLSFAPVRETVLEFLRERGEQGVRAAEITKRVRDAHGDVHWKTPSMTLYRLARRGLARRDGRIWRYVQPAEAAPKSAAPAPGAIIERQRPE